MKIANTRLGKDIKVRVKDKEARRMVWIALRHVIAHLGLYGEGNYKVGVMLDNDLLAAFSWNLSPQGHRYWEDVYYGRMV